MAGVLKKRSFLKGLAVSGRGLKSSDLIQVKDRVIEAADFISWLLTLARREPSQQLHETSAQINLF